MAISDIQKKLDRHRRRPGRHIWFQRVPFAAFAVIGMIGIVAAKFYGLPQIPVTAGAVGLLFLYWGVVTWFPALRIREDQLGDNCYYLGFLYTLASLSWALFKFTMTTGSNLPGSIEASTGITDIIANFGIALASTIVGILLRVTINQARKDVLETERDSRMALTEAMVNMRVQLDDAVIALKAFCDQNKQITADAIRDNTERANGAIEESVSRVGVAASGVLERIEEAFEEFSANSKKLNQVASSTVKAIESLIKRLESMEPPSDLITRRLDQVMESAEKAGTLLRDRLEADERAISEAARRMADMEERLKQAAGWISSAGSGLGGVSEAAVKSTRAAEEAAKSLGDLTASMRQSIAHHERMILETQAATSRLADGLIEEQKRLAEQARTSLEGLTGTLKSHSDAMAEEIDRARRMSADTGNALASLADTVTERIREMRGAAQ